MISPSLQKNIMASQYGSQKNAGHLIMYSDAQALWLTNTAQRGRRFEACDTGLEKLKFKMQSIDSTEAIFISHHCKWEPYCSHLWCLQETPSLPSSTNKQLSKRYIPMLARIIVRSPEPGSPPLLGPVLGSRYLASSLPTPSLETQQRT